MYGRAGREAYGFAIRTTRPLAVGEIVVGTWMDGFGVDGKFLLQSA